MIYRLCNNDITKKEFIEKNYDICDYVEWISFQKYERYLEDVANKRYQSKNS